MKKILVAMFLALTPFAAFAFCDKTAPVETFIEGLRSSIAQAESVIPTVPTASVAYFESEYLAAQNSKAAGRIAAVERQPFFYEWKVRRSLAFLESGVNLLHDASNPERVHQFHTIPQERIYWAVNTLNQLQFTVLELSDYIARDQARPSPMLSQDGVWKLRTIGGGGGIMLTGIVECELDRVTSTVAPKLRKLNDPD